jgi:hypothetical protein
MDAPPELTPPEIPAHDPLRQVAHPDLLAFFTKPSKSTQSNEQCSEDA